MYRGIVFALVVAVLAMACSTAFAEEIRLQLNTKNAWYPQGYKGIEEAEILSSHPDANTGGNWDIVLGTNTKGGVYGVHRLLMRWNIAELAPIFEDEDIAILSAELRIGEWYTHNVPAQRFGIYKILPANAGWVMGTVGIADWETTQAGSVSWNQKITGKEGWAGSPGCSTPGVDFDPEPVAILRSDSNINWMRPRYMSAVPLPVELVKDWALRPKSNAGLLLKAMDEKLDAYVNVISSKHGREDYGWHLHHPELVVTYLRTDRKITIAPGHLVKGGEPCVSVMIPENPTPGEKYAAQEFAEHIRKISGAELMVIGEHLYKPKFGPFVSIGRTEASKKVLDAKKFAALGDEGYNILAKNSNFYLIGGRKRGSLYAVYDYLESMGVRWYSPDYSEIPQNRTLKIPQKTVSNVPTFWYRDQYWNNQPTGEWLARMRCNGEFARIPDDMGGSAHILYGCHSFAQLIPPHEFYEEHPDWFSLKPDGNRITREYCLTNTGLREAMRDKVLKQLENTEGWAEFIWVSQNDGSLTGCYCDKCTAERKAHGGEDRWSANIISFVNFVAEAVAKRFPDVKVKTLAYSYTTEPPTGMKVADNVAIELCGNYGTEPDDKQTRLTREWAKIAKNLQVYTYGGSNYGYWWPYPNMWDMGAQCPRAMNAGVRAFYVQGTAVGAGSGMVDLRAYLSARMAWDTTRDVQKEVKAFCDAFYGPASKYVYEYVRWYSSYTKNRKMNVSGGWGDADKWRGWVTEEAMRYCDSLFQRGMEEVKDNPTYLKHLRRAYLEVLWGSIMVHLDSEPQIIDGKYSMLSEDKARELAERTRLFNEIMEENEFTVMSENVGYTAGRSQLDAVTSLYDAVELSNGSGSVWVVPSLGGKIIIWNVNELGGNILRTKAGSDPYSAGYKELGSIPFRTAKYNIVSKSERSLVAKGAVSAEVEAVKTFTLDENKPMLHMNTVLTNVSDKAVRFTLRTHPEFVFDIFGKSKLYTQTAKGWHVYELWTKEATEGEIYVDMNSITGEEFMLGDAEKNIGIINRFKLSDVATMYSYFGEDYGAINMELWTKEIVLQPGESKTIEHSYEIMTDITEMM